MEDLVKKYDDLELMWSTFISLKEKVLKGQKAGAMRSRKQGLALAKELKAFRKLTLELKETE